ncbi:hypothetical protein JMJ77_0012177, partial [Colletotrichum scovillei]
GYHRSRTHDSGIIRRAISARLPYFSEPGASRRSRELIRYP